MISKLEKYLSTNKYLLMEGALGERLKREYQLTFDEHVAMASLVYSDKGRDALRELWNGYLAIAREYNVPFLATTPTRRANKERVRNSCYTEDIIADNVDFLKTIADSYSNMLIGGLMGCKGDAYTGDGELGLEASRNFHTWQVAKFKDAGVDFLYAGIMPMLPEAVGMAQAMSESGLPYIISFTIKDNGKIIDGVNINDAIEIIDSVVDIPPVCYMTNCVHPRIVAKALQQPFNQTVTVKQRFLGIQANTSPLSYEELDNSADLKTSDPDQWAVDINNLEEQYRMKIFGGCCGTDNIYMSKMVSLLSK